MSGGSFDYMFQRAPEQVEHYGQELQRMADACTEVGLTDSAEMLRSMAERLCEDAMLLERRHALLKAVEWMCSGDTGPEEVAKAYADLRPRRWKAPG